MIRVLVVSGPNLNLLGTRQPEVYGTATLPAIEAAVAELAGELGVEAGFAQSNHEGELVEILQRARGDYDAVVFNPAAFTHYSYALADVVSAVELPVVEVHLSNIHGREQFRRTSVIAPYCVGQVAGFGADSYLLGFRAAVASVSASAQADEEVR